MYIKPSEIALTPAPAAIGPLAAVQLVLAATPSLRDNALSSARDNVSFSEVVRTLSAALAQALPELDSALVYDALSPDDRLIIANALELSRALGGDAREVRGLVLDLYAYRAPHARAEASSKPLALTLPTFSAEDEAVARTLLSSAALRDTALDHGFVRALLDPDRHPTHAMSFSFLRRLLVALSPSHSHVPESLEAAADADTNTNASARNDGAFVRRAARTTLAEAVKALGLSANDLPKGSAQVVRLGRTALHERLATLLGREDRTLLAVLYVAASQRGVAARAVDHVASALLALREAEQAELRTLRLPRPTLLPEAEHPARAPSAEAGPERARPVLGGQEEPTRSYGSDTQRAAKLAGTYKSLLPPSPLHAPLEAHAEPPAQPRAAQLARTEPGRSEAAALPQGPTLTRPLDLTQALGLGALLNELRVQARRARRPRLRRKSDPTIRAVEALPKSASEAEADDPMFEPREQPESRTHWQLLLRRRQRQRRGRAR